MSLLDSNTGKGRYGIGLLNKARLNESINLEVLIDYNSGEILSRNGEGKLIKFDANSRLESFVNFMEYKCFSNRIYGQLCSIHQTKTDTILPIKVTENTNILDTPLELTGKSNRFIFGLDVDGILYDGTIFSTTSTLKIGRDTPNEVNATLDLSVKYTKNGTEVTEPVTLTMPISQLSSYVIDVNLIKGVREVVSAVWTLNSIKINRHSNDSSKDMIIMLYGIVYCMNSLS